MREDERRWHRRRLSDFSANIVLPNQSPSVTCTVENISAGGVRIRLPTAVALPREFVLEIPSLNLRVDARVAWSRGEHHGVKFLWRQHKSSREAGASPDRPWGSLSLTG
ncbi:PilZ domain-containing protein (plasmid) [Microvirga sp. RSM25]|uniref:PilZ domain-containing protein n=1 Tax=Microvirga sp. RSM25 TaxID=3273802 RepID=UPI00384CCAED